MALHSISQPVSQTTSSGRVQSLSGIPKITGSMRITELAAMLDTTTRALRYYEDQGLVTVQRTSGGMRAYDRSAIERLRLVIALRRANVPVTNIHDLVDADPAQQHMIFANRLTALDNERTLLLQTIESLAQDRGVAV